MHNIKPIIRWTIGNALTNSSYEILSNSIKNIIKLYKNEFEYFVCYNDVNVEETNKIKKKFKKVNFLEQKWDDCPLALEKPDETNALTNQKLNGSFWKICPPRLNKNTHEIILDNDLIFIKKPRIIQKFLLEKNKNLIIEDSNTNIEQTLGSYAGLLTNKKQGYNSGIIGLSPNYDFKKEIIKNFQANNKKKLDYAEEQGLLMYTLLQTSPLIGSSKDFVGLHPEHINKNCISRENIEILKLNNSKINLNEINYKLLEMIIKQASSFHFLKANRHDHKIWKIFKKIITNKFI
jgi:hypothetical protein